MHCNIETFVLRYLGLSFYTWFFSHTVPYSYISLLVGISSPSQHTQSSRITGITLTLHVSVGCLCRVGSLAEDSGSGFSVMAGDTLKVQPSDISLSLSVFLHTLGGVKPFRYGTSSRVSQISSRKEHVHLLHIELTKAGHESISHPNV